MGGFAYAGSACDNDVGEGARHGWKICGTVYQVDIWKSCGYGRMSSLDVGLSILHDYEGDVLPSSTSINLKNLRYGHWNEYSLASPHLHISFLMLSPPRLARLRLNTSDRYFLCYTLYATFLRRIMANSLWSYCNTLSFWLISITLPLSAVFLIWYRFQGRTTEEDEWPKQIHKIPSLIPYIRHGFYLKFRPYSYTRHIS